MKKNDLKKNLEGNELNEEILDEVDEEFQDLANKLSNMDFSKNSNKEFILNNILKNMSNKGAENMKSFNRIKKTGIIAASVVIVSALMMQTTFAQDIVGKIINTISLGYVTVFQEEDGDGNVTEMPVPIALKGKLFNKDGKVIEKFTKDMDRTFYTADGEEIDDVGIFDGKITTVKEAEKDKVIVKESNKINDYTCFEVKLPSYLPNGYAFDKAEFYKDESGNVKKDSKYASFQFKNLETGKVIHMQERFACEETQSVSNSEKVEKIKINDVDAILSDDRNIDWVANGTIYSLFGKALNRDEAIKIAESIK